MNLNDKDTRKLLIKEMLENARRKADQKQTASKIFDALTKLYNSVNSNSSRRWIWELIQNAKDLSYDQTPVDITVDLETEKESYLKFKHNGKNFNIDQITYLVKQVSSKDRIESSKTTGKFGTGFLSTHLLSKTITVNGIVDIGDDNFSSFSINMDRDAESLEEMVTKVDQALRDLDGLIETSEFIDLNPKEYNTSFTYHLTEKGLNYAKNGISDLSMCLPYTLLFIDSIGEVSVQHTGISYVRNGIIPDNDISIYTIDEKYQGEVKKRYFIKLDEDDVAIAVELELDDLGNYCIKAMDESLPKIFCDFPLLGSETFGLPFVINSPHFNPTEPRDGIFLGDNDTKETNENKALMLKGVEMFGMLLDLCSGNKYGSLYNLAKMHKPKEFDWFDKVWVLENIHSVIKEMFLTTPLIRNIVGDLVPAKNQAGDVCVFVPAAKSAELRLSLYHLLTNLNYAPISPYSLPAIEELPEWISILRDSEFTLDLLELSEMLAKSKTVSELEENLINPCSILWLNDYYELLKSDETTSVQILNRNCSIKVFVNQNNEFQPYSLLKRDNQIEEALKDALAMINNDIRSTLISKNYTISDWTDFEALKNSDLIDKLNNHLRKSTGEIDLVLYLTSLLPENNDEFRKYRDKIFKLTTFVRSNFPTALTVSIIDNSLWEESDNRLFRLLTNEIATSKSIGNFASDINKSHDDTYKYLTDLISFIDSTDFSNNINLSKIAMFPDQNGDFQMPGDLSIDGGIDEELISILEALGWPLRSRLLHNFVQVPSGFMEVLDYKGMLDEFNEVVKRVFKSVERTPEDQETYTRLYSWLVDNSDISEEFFSEIFGKKERLLSDKIIRDSIDRAATLSKLEEIIGESITSEILEDPVFVRTLIESIQRSAGVNLVSETSKNETSIFQGEIQEREYEVEDLNELMLSSGVFDEAGLQILRSRVRFGKSIQDYSPYERFSWVKNLLNRAADNVISKLSRDSDYDLSHYKRDSITTLTNVLYRGNEISIVVRPNDYKKVIIYYQRELDLLKETDTQFWVDNDFEQKQITIGHILEAMRLGVILNIQ